MRYSYTFFLSFIALLISTLFIFFFYEIWLGLSCPGWWYLGMAAALGIPMGILAGGYWWKPASAGYLIFLVCLYTLHAVPWHVEKAFWMDLERVRPGMTAAEVDRLLARYIKEHAGEASKTVSKKIPAMEAVQAETEGTEYASAAVAPPGREVSGSVVYRLPADISEKIRCVVHFENNHVVSLEYFKD